MSEVKRPSWYAEAIALHQRGMTHAEIGRALGRSRHTVRHVIQAYSHVDRMARKEREESHQTGRNSHYNLVSPWKPRVIPQCSVDYNDLARQLVAGRLDTATFIAMVRGQG